MDKFELKRKLEPDERELRLSKNNDHYIFRFDPESRAETLRLLGRFASNPELSFTWYDAAVLSQKIRGEDPCGHINTHIRNRIADL